MSTQQHSAKKLSPNGVKSKLILEAIGISHEILLALMVQELIPRELPRGGLDDRRIRKFNEGDAISAEELTRMLKISLDHYDLLEKRFLAYKVAFEKIENRIKKLHDLLQKSGAGGRHLNKTLRSIAELEIANYYSKKKKHLSSEKLSELVSKEIFRQDIKKYRLDWKKKWEKKYPDKPLPSGWERSSHWEFFADVYRPLPVRTATNWLEEIKKTYSTNI